MRYKQYLLSLIGGWLAFTSVNAQTVDSSFQTRFNTKVELTTDKVTQLIFPTSIEKWRGGFNTELFVKEVYNNILYLQPLTSFEPSNLHVITADGANYSIDINYRDHITRSTYIYTIDDATIAPKLAVIAPEENESSTVLPYPTTTVHPATTTPPQKTTIRKILDEKDFIVNRSGVRYKNLSFRIAGIYYQADQLYFKCKVSNSTNIPYEFDYIGFNIQTRKQRKTTTANTEEIIPSDTYYESTTVNNKEITCVFVLKKFTVGNDHTLVISIVEKDGGRNMVLHITDDILLQARNI
ncbi:DUF4138 domain-containing protein [Bacteroides acidifaciens]|uniref:DUF4138 domain-containing protein n=1 Tax=Bacteroides acidifaciens TaxID=85831 RepID=UPI00259A94DC|nr:DUF4138 domain-containing protein [Bacteroides acidifaciens]